VCGPISIITSARPTKIARWLLVGMVLLAQPSAPQSPAKPSVGKFRACQPRPDCSKPPVCTPVQGEALCKIKTIFGQTSDPACEATRAARIASYNNCSASRRVWLSECETSGKQSELCAALRSQEIHQCEEDRLEFARLVRLMQDNWVFPIPRQVQASFAKQLNTSLLPGILVTDWHDALSPKQFIRDELKRQGWVVVTATPTSPLWNRLGSFDNDLIIFASRIPKKGDLCTWARVLATAEIADGLGADGYCQVLQFQPGFLKDAVQKKAEKLGAALKLRCDPAL